VLDHIELQLPGLPASFDGLRVAHVTDLHLGRWTRSMQPLAMRLAEQRPDLVAYTGDYMTDPGDEDAAFAGLEIFAKHVRPAFGSFGVFGNHDSFDLIERVQQLPIRWLNQEAIEIEKGGDCIEVLGLTRSAAAREDAVKLAATLHAKSAELSNPFRLLLVHHPDRMMTASDLGVDFMMSGHTHGGQVRLPWGQVLMNSSVLPNDLSSGLLRHRQTVAAVSRGVGWVKLPIRLFCPAQLPIYTLRRGESLGQATDLIECVHRW
jgi:predicted MPP superfamily phosphohydrolase